MLIATGVSALATNFIPQPALSEWGWRIPFLIGAALSLPSGLYIRNGLPETPHFIAAEQRQALERNPLIRALIEHPWESFVVFAMQMGTVMFYIWTVFLPTYAHLAGGLPLSPGFIGGIISLTVFCVATPAAGALADRIGRRPLLITYAVGFFILAWPLLRLLEKLAISSLFCWWILSAACCWRWSMARCRSRCASYSSTRLRTSGIGLPYAICAAIFGGTAPLIATWLLSRQLTGVLAIYIMALAGMSAVVIIDPRETRGTPLD